MRVTVLGVGEAFDPAYPNTAVLVEAAGFGLLVDCGHSVPPSLWRLAPEPDRIGAVYLTHHHPDHCLGLLPVLIRWHDSGRTAPLRIVTTRWGEGHLRRLCRLGMLDLERMSYTVGFADSRRIEAIGPFAARIARTRHAVANHAIQLAHGGRVLACSGDGNPTPAALALYRDADLLVHECYMAAAEGELPFHVDFARLSAVGTAGRIAVVHARADQRAAVARLVAGEPRMLMPEPGDVIEV